MRSCSIEEADRYLGHYSDGACVRDQSGQRPGPDYRAQRGL